MAYDEVLDRLIKEVPHLEFNPLNAFQKQRAHTYTQFSLNVLEKIKEHTSHDVEASLLIAQLEQLYKKDNKNTRHIEELQHLLFSLKDRVNRVRSENEYEFDYMLLPLEIQAEMRADMEEMLKCFDHESYRASTILCGRILETALFRLYFQCTQNDLLETAPTTGLGKLIAKLSEQGVQLDPGINEQIHLINKIRIQSVHKKKELWSPSKEQASAMILYTIDALKKIFRHNL